MSEIELFKCGGGSTLCEVSAKGVRIKSNTLKSIAQTTGINIVCGTGFYVDDFFPNEYRDMAIEELAQVMVNEIVTGIPGTDGVRCGIIGEIGCSWPLRIIERKSLQAAALAQQQTGIVDYRVHF